MDVRPSAHRSVSEGIDVSGENVVIDGGRAFNGQAQDHKILLDSGSGHVTMTFHANAGTVVSVDGNEGEIQEIALTDGRAEVIVASHQGGHRSGGIILVSGKEARMWRWNRCR